MKKVSIIVSALVIIVIGCFIAIGHSNSNHSNDEKSSSSSISKSSSSKQSSSAKKENQSSSSSHASSNNDQAAGSAGQSATTNGSTNTANNNGGYPTKPADYDTQAGGKGHAVHNTADALDIIKHVMGVNDDTLYDAWPDESQPNCYDVKVRSKSIMAQGGTGTIALYYVYSDGTYKIG
ncbi:hypothetical protein [Eupransor demetentiae]|uniref:Lipoprotein n=1 Tax=Eupransor demetentiae TaxID=3109584 RepID=A0ABM9N6M0_9LACO|nr:hypothetical protein R54876_GBNLAHCA_01439 [Lactobacillaceae bacterium LMG 33000]